MEVHTNGDILNGKRRILAFGAEFQFTIKLTIPQNAALGEFHHLQSGNALTLSHIRLVEGENYLLGADDAHRNRWFLLQNDGFLLLTGILTTDFFQHLCGFLFTKTHLF